MMPVLWLKHVLQHWISSKKHGLQEARYQKITICKIAARDSAGTVVTSIIPWGSDLWDMYLMYNVSLCNKGCEGLGGRIVIILYGLSRASCLPSIFWLLEGFPPVLYTQSGSGTYCTYRYVCYRMALVILHPIIQIQITLHTSNCSQDILCLRGSFPYDILSQLIKCKIPLLSYQYAAVCMRTGFMKHLAVNTTCSWQGPFFQISSTHYILDTTWYYLDYVSCPFGEWLWTDLVHSKR